MTLIKSISGIRGTIGGTAGNGLTPVDIIKYTAAYGQWLIYKGNPKKVVVGRDARLSGQMVTNLVNGTLQSLGIDVVDLGLSTTPTVELAVTYENAGGGIIITASHNPGEWNALKLLNKNGEFISETDSNEVLAIADQGAINFANTDQLGKISHNTTYLERHIEHILSLPLVDAEAIQQANFRIVVDGVNSSGGVFVPAVLTALGVKNIRLIHCIPDGIFPHNPEPLPANLRDLADEVIAQKADLGIAVDPDVDRLCFICEDGSMFGEEYTLVAVADYVLSKTPGDTVSNLSSTRALTDVTRVYAKQHYASAVGEVNVVNKIKEVGAVIGGEGNGGIIYPESHYGRDALVGIALFLSHLARSRKSISALRRMYPNYFISKNKIVLTPGLDIEALLQKVKNLYLDHPHSTIDGLKIEFGNHWVHLRRSNTEPIIRIYAEADNEQEANRLARTIIDNIHDLS